MLTLRRLASDAENTPACSALSTRANACSGFLNISPFSSSVTLSASSLRSCFVQPSVRVSTAKSIKITIFRSLIVAYLLICCKVSSFLTKIELNEVFSALFYEYLGEKFVLFEIKSQSLHRKSERQRAVSPSYDNSTRCAFSPQAIRPFWSGRREPSLWRLHTIVEALDIRVRDLFKE